MGSNTVSRLVRSICLHIPSVQLIKTLHCVGNTKDNVLACFILILDED